MTASPYARLRDAVLAYDRALKAYGLLGEHWQESPKLDNLYATMLAATLPADQDSPSQAGPCDSCEHGRDWHAFFPASNGTLGEPAPLCYGADEDESIATCECEGFAPTPVQP